MGENEASYPNIYNSFKKEMYQDDQAKQMNDKTMEYNTSSFMNPNMDSLKRLGGIPNQMNSPFLYANNNGLRPFNNYGLGAFTNEDFNTMLKNYPFPFSMPTNPSFMNKPTANGEIDEKLLDTAKMLNYLNQAGSTPLNRQNMFNLPQNGNNDVLRQANNPEFHNSYEESHDELPPMFKGYENNLPSANLNNSYRRNNFDGFFNAFDEEYGDKKKFKHN